MEYVIGFLTKIYTRKIPYSQLASAKLAICRKKTFLGESKLSFLRGLRLILMLTNTYYNYIRVFSFMSQIPSAK